MSAETHEQYARRLLTEVESGNGVSQRSLARSAGIALGLTNLLLKQLVRRGWVKVVHIRPNRVRYLITPAGAAENARMSTSYFARSVSVYAEARDRIQERLSQLSIGWPEAQGGDKRIIFFLSAGDVAEIAYVCLHSTDLRLVGVVGADAPARFMDLGVAPVAALRPRQLAGIDYRMVVVTSIGPCDHSSRHLSDCGIPADDVFWI